MQQLDLLSYEAPLPPFRIHSKTSYEAAKKVAGKAEFLRDKCLRILQSAGEYGAIPDEVAEALDADILAIRPRFSELNHEGLIFKTDMTRKNSKGNNQRVYVARAYHKEVHYDVSKQ